MDKSKEDEMEYEENVSDSSSESEDEDDEKLQEQIKELQKQIEDYPNYYDGHVNLIKLLRGSGELIAARIARENMNKRYPLSPELWLDWVKDEQIVCCTVDEKAFVTNLLERAALEYTSVELWTEYLLFTMGLGDTKESQEVANKALTAVGSHVRDGDLVWQAVFMMEKQVYANLSAARDNPDNKIQQSQKKRIQTLIRRRFNTPVLNMERDALLSEASEFFDGKIDVYMEKNLDKSLLKLKALEIFEDQLLKKEDDLASSITVYQDYLTHLLKENNPAEVQNLYERSVTKHALSAALWIDYCQYCVKQFPSNKSLVQSVCERSVRNCPWSGELCMLYIRVLERNAYGIEELKQLQDKIKATIDHCLSALKGVEESSFIENVSSIWRSYLVYLIHCIDWQKSDTDAGLAVDNADTNGNGSTNGVPTTSRHLIVFRDAAQKAIDMLRENSSERAVLFDADVSIATLWVNTELRALCPENARAVYNGILNQAAYTGRFDLWLKYINLERCSGTLKHTRKLFRRALERVWNNTEAIGTEYQLFEEVHGDAGTLQEFYIKYRNRMNIVLKKREDDIAKEEAKNDQTKGNKKNNKQKKQKQNTNENSSYTKPNRSESVPVAVQSIPKDKTTPPSKKRKIDEVESTSDTSKVTPPPGFPEKSSKNTDQKGSPSIKFKADPSPAPSRSEHRVSFSEESRTVFVSNLGFDTPVDDVKKALSDCGNIASARLVFDFKGRSKGFGYVTFVKSDSVPFALKKDRMVVDKRPMFVSSYETDKSGHKFQYSTDIEKDKLFIKGLPYSMSEQQIKEAFETHAPVTEIRLVTHRNGYSKGICFIKFGNSKAAETVREAMDQTELKGCLITVLISNPSQAKKQNEDDFNKSLKGVAPGERKSKLSFVPRSLAKGKQQNLPAKSNESGATEEIKPKSNDDFRKLLQ